MKFFKSVTIKGSLIVGTFTIISTILIIIFANRNKNEINIKGSSMNNYIYQNSKITVYNEITNNKKQYDKFVKKAIKILRKYYNNPGYDADIYSINWFSIINDNISNEFYIKYNDGCTTYIDIFSIRKNIPELIFHKYVYLGEVSYIQHIKFNNNIYILYATISGNGGWLSINIYKFDKMGQIIKKSKFGPFHSGEFWIQKDKILVSGDSQKYIISYNNNKLELLRYKKRYKYEPNSNIHVLKFNIHNNKFQILFNNKIIDFILSDNPPISRLCSKKIYQIEYGDTIVIDDNLSQPKYIRMLTDAEYLDWRNGLFPSLITENIGEVKLWIDYDYSESYYIRFKIIKKKTLFGNIKK